MSEGIFEFDTYIVLDVPPPFAGYVMDIRERHQDVFRASLPVEITVAGSSGVGVVEPGQAVQEVFSRIDEITSQTSAFDAEFGPTIRFEGTDIFVLTLVDETPFHELHWRISQSGIHFKPSLYPYKPHCCLRSRSPVTEAEAAELLGVHISGQFRLDTLSVYRLKQLPMDLLYQTKLSGKNAPLRVRAPLRGGISMS